VAETAALAEAERLTRDAHLVGAVPGFDAEVLAARMRARGICPSWHYHLQDFETLIAGYLHGRGQPVPCLPWRPMSCPGWPVSSRLAQLTVIPRSVMRAGPSGCGMR
jgi:hypothetical protein